VGIVRSWSSSSFLIAAGMAIAIGACSNVAELPAGARVSVEPADTTVVTPSTYKLRIVAFDEHGGAIPRSSYRVDFNVADPTLAKVGALDSVSTLLPGTTTIEAVIRTANGPVRQRVTVRSGAVTR
jgi:hypothetical protein